MGVEKMEIRTYKRGEVIFKQGEYEPCMYDIHWGAVGIYVNYGTSGQKQLVELKPDEFFGEMGLIEASPRSATAVALEDGTKVQVITAETFNEYFKERPAKVFMIMQHMSQRLRRLTEDYLEACRTVAEAVETEQTGKEQSGGLKERLKKFAGIYRAAEKNDILGYSSFDKYW